MMHTTCIFTRFSIGSISIPNAKFVRNVCRLTISQSHKFSTNPNSVSLSETKKNHKYELIDIKPEDNNNGLRRIIMNDKKTRNSLSLKMMSELINGISHDSSSDKLRAITLESTEGPVFCAGHNLKEMTKGVGIEQQKLIFSTCTKLMLSIRKAEVPVIGVINGLAAAAGCQLVSACDFSISSTKSTFSTPGANFGLFCSTPGIGISRVMNRSSSAYMLLTGITLSADEALRVGLIVKAVPEGRLEQELQETYAHIAAKSRPVIALGKQFFYDQLKYNYEDAMKHGEGVMVQNLQLNDCQEGLQGFKEKRKPNWPTAINIIPNSKQ